MLAWGCLPDYDARFSPATEGYPGGKMKKYGNSRLLFIAMLVACLGVSGTAYAGCSQKKIAGTWYGQSYFVDSVSGLGYWLVCKLKVNGKGIYTPASSVCVYDTSDTYYPYGQLKLRSSCLIDAAWVDFYDVFDNYVYSSYFDVIAVDKQHTVMQAVGDSGTVEPFIFNAVKR
jgi:hypothetical protein